MSEEESDVLVGAQEIVDYMYPKRGFTRRKGYHIIRKGLIPVWRVGNQINASKKTLDEFKRNQESSAYEGEKRPKKN